MECKNCGTVNDQDGKFCKECGSRLDSESLPTGSSSDSHVRIGELIYAAYKYKENGKIEDAMLACQGALALNSNNAQAHSLLASLYEFRGDLLSAVSEYERVVQLNPNALAESATLDALRARLGASAVKVSWIDARLGRFAPQKPKIYAALAFLMVVIVGSIWVKSVGHHQESQSPAIIPISSPSAPTAQVTPPIQPAKNSPEQPAAGQDAVNAVQPASQKQATPDVTPNEHSVPPSRTIPQDQPESQVVKPKVQKSSSSIASKVAKLFIRPVTPQHTATAVHPSAGSDSNSVIVPVEDAPLRPAVKSTYPAITPSGTITVRHAAPVVRPARPAVPVGPEDRAYSLQSSGRYQEAIASYHEAMPRTSDTGRIYQQIGICYKRLGKNGAAADNFNRAIKSYKDQLSAGGDAADLSRRIKTCEAEISAN